MSHPKHIVIDARIRRTSTGRYVDRLVTHLQGTDTTNQYTILVSPDDTWQMTAPNFKTRGCPYPQFSINPLIELKFAWEMYRLKADLVHFTMTQQPLLYFGNIVTTTHDLTMFEYARAGRLPEWLHRIRLALYKFLFWWSHFKSQAIIVPTQYVADGLAKYQPSTGRKLTVTLEASEPAISKAGIKPAKVSQPYILYVGSSFPHKNLEQLILAHAKLNTSQPELNLILVGKREHYSFELEKFAKSSGVFNKIIFTGFVDDVELKWLYQNAKAYVFPSLSEGFGLPGLEAMTYGCPVVSSNATCLPEVYQDAAEYFDPSDVSGMVAAIQSVINNPAKAADLRAKGYKVITKYSWQTMADQTLAIYKKLLS